MSGISVADLVLKVLVETKTGKKIHVGGLQGGGVAPAKVGAFTPDGRKLPAKVDLRPWMSRVEDQSQANSCSANAVVGAYEYLQKKGHGAWTDMSRLFVYWHARRFDRIPTDAGSSITSNLRTLQEFGVCPESVWGYDLRRVNAEPPQAALDSARKYRAEEAMRVPVSLGAMRGCLAEGYPIVFGLALFNTFDKAGRAGVVPMPDFTSDQGRKQHGCHAMLAVGYSDKDRVFVVRNSWGEGWGDKGYCYIPYDYLANPKLAGDLWTLRDVTDVDLSKDVADEDRGFNLDYGSLEGSSGYLFETLESIEDAVRRGMAAAQAQQHAGSAMDAALAAAMAAAKKK